MVERTGSQQAGDAAMSRVRGRLRHASVLFVVLFACLASRGSCRWLQDGSENTWEVSRWPDIAAVINGTVPAPSPNLIYNCQMSSRKMDIVVSYFQEDRSDLKDKLSRILAHPKVAPLAPCVTIYCKGNLTENVTTEFPWATAVPLENVGKESHTYLHHMAEHHDDLPAHMLFIQGRVERPDTVMRILSALTPTTGFMCLANWGRSSCDGGEYKVDRRMREVWAMARKDFCFEDFTICYRGHFLVSGARVRYHPAAFYRRLRDLLALPAGHIIHQDGQLVVHGMKEGWDHRNPLLGHTMERAWTFMFNCHEPKEQLPQLLPVTHGTRACRCFMEQPTEPLRIGEPGECSYEAMRQGCQCVDLLPHARRRRANNNASQQI